MSKGYGSIVPCQVGVTGIKKSRKRGEEKRYNTNHKFYKYKSQILLKIKIKNSTTTIQQKMSNCTSVFNINSLEFIIHDHLKDFFYFSIICCKIFNHSFYIFGCFLAPFWIFWDHLDMKFVLESVTS